MYEEFTGLTLPEALTYCAGSERQPVRDIIANELRGMRVLDLCCGNGIDAERYDPELYTGIDISPVLVEAARQLHPGHVFEVADATALPFDDGFYEAVVIKSALEHVPSQEIAASIVNEAVRVCSVVTYVAWHTPPSPLLREPDILLMLGHFGRAVFQNRYCRNAFDKILTKTSVGHVGQVELWRINP